MRQGIDALNKKMAPMWRESLMNKDPTYGDPIERQLRSRANRHYEYSRQQRLKNESLNQTVAGSHMQQA